MNHQRTTNTYVYVIKTVTVTHGYGYELRLNTDFKMDLQLLLNRDVFHRAIGIGEDIKVSGLSLVFSD